MRYEKKLLRGESIRNKNSLIRLMANWISINKNILKKRNCLKKKSIYYKFSQKNYRYNTRKQRVLFVRWALIGLLPLVFENLIFIKLGRLSSIKMLGGYLGHWRILGNRLFKIKMIRKLEFVLGILDC
jgi:hypothetical protein